MLKSNAVLLAKNKKEEKVEEKKKLKMNSLKKLNIFHDNIKLTIEENPTKFQDTGIARQFS